MHCFLEVGAKGLGGHVHGVFLATMHVMEQTFASGNKISGVGNIVEKSVTNFV